MVKSFNPENNENFDIDTKEYVAAVDIGTSKMSLAIGEIVNGRFNALFGVADSHSSGIEEGRIINVSDTARILKNLINDAASMYGFKIEEIIIGITDPDVKIYKNDAMCRIQENTVSIQDIENVMEAAKAIPLGMDEYMLHVLPLNFSVNGKYTTKPLGVAGVRLDVETNVFTVPYSSIKNVFTVCELAGIEIRDIVYSPLAINYSVSKADQLRTGLLLIDIGAGTTDVTFFENNALQYTFVLPVGGRFITGDISATLGCTLENAENLKLNVGCASPAYIDNADDEILDAQLQPPYNGISATFGQLSEIIEARVNEILELSLKDFFEYQQNWNPQYQVIVTGGTSNLIGIMEYVAGYIQFKVSQEYGMNLTIQTTQGIPNLKNGEFDYAKVPKFSAVVGLLKYNASSGGLKKFHRIEDISDNNQKSGLFDSVKSFFSAFFD